MLVVFLVTLTTAPKMHVEQGNACRSVACGPKGAP